MLDKQYYINRLMTVLEPLKKYYSPQKANLNIGVTAAGYEEKSRGMEGFSRILWGLVPLWNNTDEKEFLNIYIQGITSGTDKASPQYWGDCHDFDQKFVEMAAIAYWLIVCPNKLLQRITDKQKTNLFEWLLSINEHEVVPNNWIMFRVLINIAMKKNGYRYSQKQLDIDLAKVDTFYSSNGWYVDGHTNHKDYYVPFAIYFYSLIYVYAMQDEDKERCDIIKERAYDFAQEFIYWFDENGEALAYGRSLTYRFAMCCFWSGCVLADVYPFDISVIKGIITRNIDIWLNNNDIFDNAGLLTIGYKYPNLIFEEHYNAPGSPYWALKAFAFLALDENHPFWKAEVAPLPKLESKKLLRGAEMYVTRYNGHVFAFPKIMTPLGNGQCRAKYTKFSYSTLNGFSVMYTNDSLEEAGVDSTLAFVIDNLVFTCKEVYDVVMSDTELTYEWSPFMGIKVKTTIIPFENGHKRVHIITSDYDCVAFDCGYSIAARDWDEYKEEQTCGNLTLSNSFQYCRVVGKDLCVINASPNTNIMYVKTKIPASKIHITKGTHILETTFYIN